MMWWWPGGAGSGWAWAVMTIGMLLFWGVLIAGGIALVRALNRLTSGSAQVPRPTPQQVLADRFARGEIDEDEYRRRLAALSSSGSVTRP